MTRSTQSLDWLHSRLRASNAVSSTSRQVAAACVALYDLLSKEVAYLETRQVQAPQVGATLIQQPRQHPERRLLGQVHQDDARHEGHALAVVHLQGAQAGAAD
jgi:hypothetical protein